MASNAIRALKLQKGLNMAGDQQSPINLEDTYDLKEGSLPLSIHWEPKLVAATLDLGHGVQLMLMEGESYARFRGKDYRLLQFHFHHPSEHVIVGERRFMEIHFVHQNLHDATRLVLAVFAEIGDDEKHTAAVSATKFLDEVIDRMIPPGTDFEVNPMTRNPNDLLPPKSTRQNFWHYEGSLTTDPYTENVTWVIFREPIYVIESKAEMLIHKYRTHYRDLQPRNRRLLVSHKGK